MMEGGPAVADAWFKLGGASVYFGEKNPDLGIKRRAAGDIFFNLK